MRKILYIAWSFLQVLNLVTVVSADDFSCSGKQVEKFDAGIVESVEKAFAGLSSLHAQFLQQSYLVGLDHEESSKGEVSFKKPGMMDWQYQAPDIQRFVADGRILWFYQPELKQVIISEFKAAFNSDLPVSFLLGLGKLSTDFHLVNSCKNQAENRVLEFVPSHHDASLEKFYLIIDDNSYLPSAAKIKEITGNQTSIILSKIIINPKVTDQQFVFEIPKGTDLIDNREK